MKNISVIVIAILLFSCGSENKSDKNNHTKGNSIIIGTDWTNNGMSEETDEYIDIGFFQFSDKNISNISKCVSKKSDKTILTVEAKSLIKWGKEEILIQELKLETETKNGLECISSVPKLNLKFELKKNNKELVLRDIDSISPPLILRPVKYSVP